MSRIPEAPLAGFERRLLDALTEVDAERPAAPPTVAGIGVAVDGTTRPVGRATRPRWTRPGLVAASVASLVAGTSVVGSLLATPDPGQRDGAGPNTDAASAMRPAAFAVRINTDGSVSFTAHDLVDPAAATRSLNGAGIAGRVVNNTNGCDPIDSGDLAPGLTKGPHPRPHPSDTGRPPAGFVTGDNTITVRSSEYPPGGGVLVVVQLRDRPTGPWAAVLYWAYADVNQIPGCVDVTDPGTD